MPAFAPITLAGNGKTVNFTPLKLSGSVASWTDFGALTLALQPQLTSSVVAPSKTSSLYKSRVKMVVPFAVLDVNDDETAVVDHLNSFDITFLFDKKSTLETRRQTYELCKQALANALLQDTIELVRPVY